ncbi:hypothetical protein Pmar_PMAR009613 [Perkinsus marinus ATCC 50983]|uniref:Uncharacterized protein n=1 Tax=Perkinsus marinus (strain ATCC 50983 / TXsc) TaxID=423536 RepID=C5L955_PERM5|nr:hypothetical protein Pmar_PMAR009613 [Perkinsus marinus ATCC 50983]EER06738.1 hypothetical protein Pmar_PMAR009613 [Perkinsus marinus ATCC 50983]|eukprot:XP_002774922.1 hypothetical protein Pmar_PMAR009613 [Perkinsus marinus ATCC 50983]
MAAEGIEEVEDGRQSKPEAGVTSSGQAEAQGSGTAIKISTTPDIRCRWRARRIHA